MTTRSGGRLYTLDGMRGLAAIGVVAYHLQHVGICTSIPAGYLAVDFFFALSGLVIGLAYERRLRDGMRVVTFAKMRLIRLWPLYVLGSVLSLLCLALRADLTEVTGWTAPGMTLAGVLATAMLPDPGFTVLYPLNPPAWSLFFELVANLVFAALYVRLRTRWLIGIALIGLATTAALIMVYHLPNQGPTWVTFPGGAGRVTFAFTFGIVLARYSVGVPRRTSWIALAAPAMLLAPIVLSYRLKTDVLTIAVLIPASVIIASRFELPSLFERPCEVLGDLSYPLYAIHYPLLYLWHAAAHAWNLAAFAQAILFLAGSAVIAAMLVPLDARVRRALTARLAARPSAAPQVL